MAGIRERALRNRGFVQTQMAERERRNVLDDVGMTEQERRLNARLLDQAVRVVGGPKQLTVKF